MAREPKYGVTINSWERLLVRLEANIEDFPHLEFPRAELATKLGLVREASAEQAALTAGKQDADSDESGHPFRSKATTCRSEATSGGSC